MTGVAAVEFVLLAGAAVALFGNPLANRFSTSPAAAAARPRTHATHEQAQAAPTLTRSETSVIVLNAGGRAGAAAATAQLVRSRGYLVASVGNAAHSDGGRSVVMYRPGFAPEGARLARDLHVRIVSPLDGMRPAQLVGAHLVVLVS